MLNGSPLRNLNYPCSLQPIIKIGDGRVLLRHLDVVIGAYLPQVLFKHDPRNCTGSAKKLMPCQLSGRV